MKILLLNPNRRPKIIGLTDKDLSYFYQTVYSPAQYHSPDICTELAYMASMLKDKHKVMIVDAQSCNLTNKKVGHIIIDFNPDISVLSSASFQSWRCYPLTVKHILNSAPLLKGVRILTGPHGSSYKTSIFQNHFDFVIKGEPEEAVVKIVNGDWANLQGVGFRSNDGWVERPGNNYVGNYDALPFPAYELLPFKHIKKLDTFQINTTRGCPYVCTFCVRTMWGRVYRKMSPENVAKHVRFIKDNYGFDRFYFGDDSFGIDRRHLEGICDAVKPLEIGWETEMRAEGINEEVLIKMRDAGCYKIGVGFETANSTIMKLIDKHLTLEAVKKAVDAAKKVDGILFGLFVVFCLPGETEETGRETLEFLKSLDLKTPFGIGLETPYPGTPDFQRGIEQGRIKEEWVTNLEWEKIATAAGTIQNAFETTENARQFQRKMVAEYVLTYGNKTVLELMLKKLAKIRNLREASDLVGWIKSYTYHRNKKSKEEPAIKIIQ